MPKAYKYEYSWELRIRFPGGFYDEKRFRTKKAAMEYLENLCKTYQGLESRLIERRRRIDHDNTDNDKVYTAE